MIFKDGRKLSVLIILIIFLTDLFILLNIPFLRQMFGFCFLTILPGLLIIENLKLNRLDLLEKFILSWGLSISFLIFFGLLINTLLTSLGYDRPLTTISLLISFNIAFIILIIISNIMNADIVYTLQNLNMCSYEKAFLIIPVTFPVLSIFGIHIMNTTGNNIFLMFLLFLIPIYVIFICLFNKNFSKKFYPIMIFLISISILLLVALRSNHIMGADVHAEYSVFRTTLNNLHWSIEGYSVYNTALSISLLPTIYQSILNIDQEFMYKTLFSLLFSVSPLIIYIISKKYIEELYAFLASIFFISQALFIYTEFNPRTTIAILFFALAMMVLFNDKIDLMKKRILFIVFVASSIVSHYSTTYIFFLILVAAFIGMKILSLKYKINELLSSTMLLLFFALIFMWYSQVTESAFTSGVDFIDTTVRSLNNMFIKEMRTDSVRELFGEDIKNEGIAYNINFFSTWMTFVYIGVGIITLIIRYKEISFPELNFKKSDILKDKFEVGYSMIALSCTGLLVIVVAFPFITEGYDATRPFTVAIVILSIFFIIGGITLSRYLKVQAYFVILLVLIPFFLSSNGVTYAIFEEPRSVVLTSSGAQYDLLYISDQDSYGASWINKYREEKSIVHTNHAGRNSLISQSEINTGFIDDKPFSKNLEDIHSGYIYVKYAYSVQVKSELNKIYDSNAIIYKAS